MTNLTRLCLPVLTSLFLIFISALGKGTPLKTSHTCNVTQFENETTIIDEEITKEIECWELKYYQEIGYHLNHTFTSSEDTSSDRCQIIKPSNVRTKLVKRIEQKCCMGWEGEQCNTPICTPTCENGGRCRTPGICQCSDRFSGHRCELHSVSTKTSNRHYATCLTHLGEHYQTFDGRKYNFHGDCSYTLLASTSGDYNIITQNIQCSNIQTCRKKLVMKLGILNIVVIGAIVMIDDKIIDETRIPYQEKGVVIKRMGDLMFLESSLGLRIKWDRQSYIHIKIPNHPDFFGKTLGLCGSYDDDPTNDFEMENSDITYLPVSFGNSWKVHIPDQECPDVNERLHPCDLHLDRHQLAVTRCQVIREEPFQQCINKLNPDPYFDNCYYDVCRLGENDIALEDTLCQSLTHYARECASLGLVMEWRSPKFCARECIGGQVFSECTSACPRTCATVNYDTTRYCSPECIPGCHCPEGKYIHDGQCLEQQQCPCVLNRVEYVNGTSVTQQCNQCKCTGGIWACTNNVCNATCSVYGAGHYITFDKTRYSFQGICQYTLVEDFVDLDLNIVIKTKDCGSYGSVACIYDVTATCKNTEIQLKRNFETFVNGKRVRLPFRNDDVHVKKVSSVFTMVESTGVQLLWDNDKRLYVKLAPRYMRKVRGLCGTFTFRQDDDFLTREGDIDNSAISFANKFKIGDDCLDVDQEARVEMCNLNANFAPYAHKYCGIMSSDVFTGCHGEVDYDDFYQECLHDVCGSYDQHGALCSALAVYARECTLVGVIVEWRNKTLDETSIMCGGTCSSGMVYTECAPTCSLTCSDIAYNGEVQTCDVIDKGCIAGCVCPSGEVLDHGEKCVSPNNCTCMDRGRVYHYGNVIQRGCQTCSCKYGKWQCEGEKDDCTRVQCPNNQEFTKYASPCPMTCDNMDGYMDCGISTSPGCDCPAGLVFDTWYVGK
ncbi:SCO-spondin-like [Glandiceps talaboti]